MDLGVWHEAVLWLNRPGASLAVLILLPAVHAEEGSAESHD